MCSVTACTCRHYNDGSTPLTVLCERTPARGWGSGGGETGRGASQTRVNEGSVGRLGRHGPRCVELLLWIRLSLLVPYCTTYVSGE